MDFTNQTTMVMSIYKAAYPNATHCNPFIPNELLNTTITMVSIHDSHSYECDVCIHVHISQVGNLFYVRVRWICSSYADVKHEYVFVIRVYICGPCIYQELTVICLCDQNLHVFDLCRYMYQKLTILYSCDKYICMFELCVDTRRWGSFACKMNMYICVICYTY